MRRLLDTNTWIALTIESHPHHAVARKWYDDAPLTRGELLFCRATEISYLRLLTQQATMISANIAPLTNSAAMDFIANVYHDPAVAFATEPTAVRALWFAFATLNTPSPNVWMDAYLAAFAITSEAELVTFDHAFAQFESRGLPVQLLSA